MIRSHLVKVIAVAALLAATMLPAHALAAYNPFGKVDCREARTSTVCQTDGSRDPVTGPNGILLRATSLMATIAGIAAVIIMVVAGITYITSAGDPNTINTAKNTIIYAIVGLVVIIAGQSILSFVIGRI